MDQFRVGMPHRREGAFPVRHVKPETLNSKLFSEQNECLEIGDIVYLPEAVSYGAAGNALRSIDDNLRSQVFGDKKDFTDRSDALVGATLLDTYCHYFQVNNKEPAWAAALPPICQRFVRREHMIREHDSPLSIVPEVPLTSVGYIVSEGGITEDSIKTFGLWRLSNVAQLGKLTDPAIQTGESQTYPQEFNHKRFIHLLNVRAIIGLMAARNNLDEKTTNTIIVAALVHDMYTPAGGDTIKLADPARFDEDARFSEILQNPEYLEFLRKYNIDPKLLVDIVQGNNNLSVILDIADKISYLGLDAKEYANRYGKYGPVDYPAAHEGSGVFKAIESNKKICDIWDGVVMSEDKVVILDGERLGEFLKLRALMTHDLYSHPGARFMENLVGRVIMPYLIKEKSMDEARLFRANDSQIDSIISTMVNPEDALHFARVEVFYSIEEAEEAREELRGKGVKISFIENLKHKTSGADKYMVPPKDGGKPIPFAEAFPEKVAELEDIIKPEHPFRLYYLDKNFPASGELIKAVETIP